MLASLTRPYQQPTLSRTSFHPVPHVPVPTPSSQSPVRATTSLYFLVLSSRASSFSSAFLPRRTESLRRTIAAESFRLEISTRMPALPPCRPIHHESTYYPVRPPVSTPLHPLSNLRTKPRPPVARIDREKEEFAGNKFFGDSLPFRLAEPAATSRRIFYAVAAGLEWERKLDENISRRRTESGALAASCCSGGKNKDGRG